MKYITILIVAIFAVGQCSVLRINGGYIASIATYPYQVSIRIASKNSHFCGGSIINNNWILTSARCVIGKDPTNMIVVAGTNDLQEEGATYKVDQYFYHEEYDSEIYANDIALIKVQTTIEFNENVNEVQLETEFIKENISAIFTGWGQLKQNEFDPNLLRFLKYSTISTEACVTKLFSPNIDDRNLCVEAGYGHGACKGDFGGPLVIDNKIIGVASWVKGCGEGYPDVFTRVSVFTDWIFKVLALNS